MQGLLMAFVRFPIELFDLKDSDEAFIMLRIIFRMDAKGFGVCFESRTSMCAALGMNPKTWSKKIDSLESKGLILVDRKHRVPHHISLSKTVKSMLEGKNDSLTIFNNMDLVGRSILPPRTSGGETMDQEDKKKIKKNKVVRRRRPTNKIQSDPPLSELDAIHRKFLSKSVKTRKSDTEDSGS
jgi:hypothetical protein